MPDFRFEHLKIGEEGKHLELMRLVFGEDSRVDLMVNKWIDHHPFMTLEDFLVAKHREEIVAALCLIPSKWSIGGVEFKVAELGCVATHPEYRRRGLQRKLMKKYHQRVEKKGYDLSVIEGIPYFYRQFGYEYAIPLNEQVTVSVKDIPDYTLDHTIRPLEEEDLSEAMELLEFSQSKFLVHSVRDKQIWRMERKTHMVEACNFSDYCLVIKGNVAAYLRTSENVETGELFLKEITEVNEAEARSILAFLKQIGIAKGLETLVCRISHQERFFQVLATMCKAKQSKLYAWQIRLTNHVRMLRKMKTLFEERVESSACRDLTQTFNLNLYRHTIQMTFKNGSITGIQKLRDDGDNKVRFNPEVFTQLLLGYRSREELEQIYPDFIVSPERRSLVDVLFPKLVSYIHTVY